MRFILGFLFGGLVGEALTILYFMGDDNDKK
jgi:hypothetical protein